MIIFTVRPLESMQLLWINLVTDSLPAIALGMEAVEEGVMKQKPKPKTEGLFVAGDCRTKAIRQVQLKLKLRL